MRVLPWEITLCDNDHYWLLMFRLEQVSCRIIPDGPEYSSTWDMRNLWRKPPVIGPDLWNLALQPFQILSAFPALELIKLWVLPVLPSFLEFVRLLNRGFLYEKWFLLSSHICHIKFGWNWSKIALKRIDIQTQPSRSDHHKTTSEESESPLICICPWNMLGQSIWEHTFKIF